MILSPSYRSFMLSGWQDTRRNTVLLPAQLFTYSLLIIIFGTIFSITPFEELPSNMTLTATMVIWYVIITEMVTFIGGGINFNLMRMDVLEGEFHATLQRPKSYFVLKFLHWIGDRPIKMLAFCALGIVMGLAFTGVFPFGVTHCIFAIISIFLGTLLYGSFLFPLSLIELWGPYARPSMWVNQKLAFVLGGLLLPLQLYPQWLQDIAYLTPYPAMLNIPARIAFSPTLTEMMEGILIQIFWLLLIIGICVFMQHRAYQKILRGEG